jgi:hypothetical protein
MINFQTSAKDTSLIGRIADRALEIQQRYRPPVDRRKKVAFMMDLSAVHNTCPLDLERLLAADDATFAHDVFGIERHLDRDDDSPSGGWLGDCFVPRCAA